MGSKLAPNYDCLFVRLFVGWLVMRGVNALANMPAQNQNYTKGTCMDDVVGAASRTKLRQNVSSLRLQCPS